MSRARARIIGWMVFAVTIAGCGGGGGGSGTNGVPVATGLTIATDEDIPVSGNLPVSDPDGDGLRYAIVTHPSLGTVSLVPSTGQFTYTPSPNRSSSDSFQFKANDGSADSNIETVSITINAINDPPQVSPDSAGPVSDNLSPADSVQGNVRDNDFDQEEPRGDLQVTAVNGSVTSPVAGTYGSLEWLSNGGFIYTLNNSDPDTDALRDGETAMDVFTYRLTDNGVGGSPPAPESTDGTLTVTIVGANDPPLAVAFCDPVQFDDTNYIGQLQATDPENDPIVFSEVPLGSTKGTWQVTDQDSGSYTYQPPANGRRGTDTLRFEATDDSGASSQADVTIVIEPIRIMPLGDSITLGKYTDPDPPPNERVGYRLALYDDLDGAGYNVDFVGSLSNGSGAGLTDTHHEGHAGFTIQQIAGGIDGWLSAAPADIILLHVGTNNLDGTTAQSQIQAAADAVADDNGSSILDEIDQWETANHSVAVVLARIIKETPFSDSVQTDFNDAVQANIGQRSDRIVVVDQETALDYPDDLSSDGVHPNQVGYGRMAPVWQDALVNFGLVAKCRP